MTTWTDVAQFLYADVESGDGFWYAKPLKEIEGLTDEQLFWVPDPKSLCVLWHVGHVAHRESTHITSILQASQGKPIPSQFEVFGTEWCSPELEATCNVVVTDDEAGPGLKVEIADMDAGHRRALVEQSGEHVVIRIMGRHPAVRRYLGPGREFPGQELCVSRAMVAEIVAAEACRMVMERKFAPGAADTIDVPELYVEHSRCLRKYLSRCHRVMVPESRIRL